MCLIIFSPTGALVDRSVFDHAHLGNPHGIGVMSRWGVHKFFGLMAEEDAWCHLSQLAESRVPYGIHFRLATHGEVTAENCHPFHAPNSDAVVMHNGVLGMPTTDPTSARSDTSLFVERHMAGAPGPEANSYGKYYRSISRIIGRHNMFLIFHTLTGEFTICNESSGEWADEHWYSNPFYLPWYLEDGIGGMYGAEFAYEHFAPDEVVNSINFDQREIEIHRLPPSSDEEGPVWGDDLGLSSQRRWV